MKINSFINLTIILPVTDEVQSLKKTIEIICNDSPNEDLHFLFVCHKKKTITQSISICNKYLLKDSSKYKLIFQNLPNLGGAIRNGFDEIKTSHCVMMSSDLETDPHIVKTMIDNIKKKPNSVITANRWSSINNFYGYGKIKILLNLLFQKFFSF